MVWTEYSDARFKETLRVSRGTFVYILNQITQELERKSLNERPLSPDFRLAICLYKLSRGDYYFTISELTGVGKATVCVIVTKVCTAIVLPVCTAKHYIVKSACVHMFGATLQFDATELNATYKSLVVFCHITVEFNCI